jgi:aconitate decarboxylase
MDGIVAMIESADRIELLIAHIDSHRDPLSVPVAARDAAKKFVFDSIGVALAGGVVPQSTLVLNAARAWGSGVDARVWGSAQRLPAPSAAMVNAFHIHNQEFDCVHERAVVHPMAVILAALFAVAERESARKKNVPGTAFLAALALAVDVAATIGMCATKPLRFFRPAMCGCLGAAAGAALLYGFNKEQMRDAFGIAYSQLAGTMQAHVEGTPTLALQVAFAARAAVCAVDLAAAGFRGPHKILDGQHGYFALFEAGAAPDAAFAELGKIWQIERVSHKPFPTGRAAHGGIAGLRVLMAEHGFSSGEVESVVLAAPPLIRQLVDRPMMRDMNISYARLCLPYLAAVTMVQGTVTLDAYRAENLGDLDIFLLASLVKLVPDKNSDPNALAPQHLTVRLKSGRIFEHAMPAVFGAPEAPMSASDQQEKFADCCRHATHPLNSNEIQALATAIDNTEQLNDITSLLDLTLPESI